MLLLAGWTWLSFIPTYAQKTSASETYVHFYSSAPVEDIEAVNHEAKSVIDLSDGRIAFSVPINKFQFDKPLMQEHFNENYLESDKYPTATFEAAIQNWQGVKPYPNAIADGKFTIHGVTTEREMLGEIILNGNQLVIDAVFWVQLADHKIKIPKAVFYNIAEKVKVTVKVKYELTNP